MSMRRYYLIKGAGAALIAIIFLLQAGCAGLDRELGIERLELKSEDEAVVFGRLLFFEDGKRMEYSWSGLPRITLFSVESGRTIEHEVDFDGYFYWVLPRGRYIVRNINYVDDFAPSLVLQVPYGANAYYAGDVTMYLAGAGKGRKDRMFVLRTLSIKDAFYSTMDVFMAKHSYFRGRIDKRLMVRDGSIPVYAEDRTVLIRALERLGIGEVKKQDSEPPRGPFLEMRTK